jgi:hypothetical protein
VTVLYPAALGSPLPSRPGLGLTLMLLAEGFGDDIAFQEAAADLWERLVVIPPLEALDDPNGNCTVYLYRDGDDPAPYGVAPAADGALAADPDALLAALGDLQLAEPTGAAPLSVLTDLPWPNDGASTYATSLVIVLVDAGLHTERGEWLGVDRLDVPYHVIVSAGDQDAVPVAIALGRMAGLADETGTLADTPAFSRRRVGINLIPRSLQDRIDAGTAADPWLPWRGSPAFAPQDVTLDGQPYLRPGGPTLLAVPRRGAIPADMVARGYGLTGAAAFGGWL